MVRVRCQIRQQITTCGRRRLEARSHSSVYPLKRGELASHVFGNEYQVAMVVIVGIEARGQPGGYTVERFRFN